MPIVIRPFFASIVFLAMASQAVAQNSVSEIKLRTNAVEALVRPLESLVVQVLAYRAVVDEDGNSRNVRIQRDGATVSLQSASAGWLSKPFRFQGPESEPFYERPGRGLGSVLFGRATGQFVLQDSVLYTAPPRPGEYEIEAELGGKTARLTIRVERNAPSRRKAERSIAPERPAPDPYRRLAEHYAPFIAQETWFQPKSDYLARFDSDGDWRGDNNWDSAEAGSSQAYVYYAAMETETHWFLVYNFFHPRDYSDKCVGGSCHENDNEGLILTIEKDGSPVGRLQTMETLAHNNIYSYRADRRVKNNAHNIDGDIELYERSHPVIFIESGGHGVYGSVGSHSRYSLRSGKFKAGTGATYVYSGSPERPAHPNARNVGYDLLPIYDYWWLRAHDGRGQQDRTFDSYYEYQPFGGRPRAKHPQLAGSFLGRRHGSNKAKPFWGWHDNRTRKEKRVATGQWGLDPAYAVSQNLRMPQPFSLDYVFNPYLEIGDARSPHATEQPRQQLASARESTPAPRLPEFLPRRSKGYNPNSKKGQFDIRMHVDAAVEVFIQGNVVRYRTLGGRPPRNDGSEHSQPIPQARFRKFELEKKDGRGSITLVEKPEAGNEFTAKLRIDDPKGGDDRYHARLRWQWEELTPIRRPQPPAPNPSLSEHAEDLLEESPREDTESVLPGSELFSGDNNPNKYDRKSSGLFEFRGRVDGTVVFRIRGDRVFAEALEGRPVQVERFSFSQSVPTVRLKEVSVERKDGRGSVVLLERPWEGNRFTAMVQVSDPKGGDDRYHFRLKWKR